MSKPVYQPVGTLGDGGKSEIRVRTVQEHGRIAVDLRIFESLGVTSGLFSPTKSGLTIEVQDIPAIVRLLTDAADMATEARGGIE